MHGPQYRKSIGLYSVLLGLTLEYWLRANYPGGYGLVLPVLWVTFCVVIPTYIATLACGVIAIIALGEAKNNVFLGYTGLLLSAGASAYFWYKVFVLLRT